MSDDCSVVVFYKVLSLFVICTYVGSGGVAMMVIKCLWLPFPFLYEAPLKAPSFIS